MNCECYEGSSLCSDCQDYWEDVYIHSEGPIQEEC